VHICVTGRVVDFVFELLDLGPNLQKFVKRTFIILLHFFCMSANKLSFKKFTKEMRKNYEKTYHKLESYKRVTNSLRKVYETIRNSLITFS